MIRPSYSNTEKRQAVLTLLTHPDWQFRSNREIARECGVSLDLVNRLRKVVQPSERHVQIQEFINAPEMPKEQSFHIGNTTDLSERVVQIKNVTSSTDSPSTERIVQRKGTSYKMNTVSIGKSKRTFDATASTEDGSGPSAS